MSDIFTPAQADELVKQGLARSRILEPDILPATIDDFSLHLRKAARYAAAICRHIPNLNDQTGYVFGCLHDYGKFFGDVFGRRSFHGYVGYVEMLKLAQPEIARVCLTHTFFSENFNLDDYKYCRPDLIATHNLLKNMQFDDYDKLMQLVDLLAGVGDKGTGIRPRIAGIAERYRLQPDFAARLLQSTLYKKAYFDAKCGTDVLYLLGDADD